MKRNVIIVGSVPRFVILMLLLLLGKSFSFSLSSVMVVVLVPIPSFALFTKNSQKNGGDGLKTPVKSRGQF